ncbi:MAG: hypothetical protein SFW67_10235 [Myxococcaceae bacterium]|nr:hypothetical protein [Myxococcaceae bacterium]
MDRGAALDVLTPLDAARSAVLRMSAPLLTPFFGDRERRVLWLGVGSVVMAFVLTGLAPLWLLALGPVVLGVPHLLADVRYLVVKPRLHRDVPLMLGLGVPLVAVTVGAPPVFGVLSVLVAALSGPRSWRQGLAFLAVAALAAVAWGFPDGFQLAFVHGHNLVAIGLWFALRPRPSSHGWIPGLALAGSAFILVGGLDPLVTAMGGWRAPGTGSDFGEFVVTHTSGLDPTVAAHVVLSFCFLQSVHYAMWLRLIPDDARERRAPRTFRASWRALAQDFGLPALAAVGGLAVGLAAWGIVELPAARTGYLHLATFHGYLELAIAARWFVKGRPA